MSSDNNETRHVQITVADPTPLGLFGLSVVTFVASMQKLGVVSDVSWVIPWASIFGAFGFFWSGVAMSWMIKAGTFGAGLAAGVDPKALGFAFLAYFMFACIATIAAAEANTFLFVDMLLIDVLLLCLGLDTLGVGGHWAHDVAAYSELAISLLSMYGAGAVFLNNFFGRVFWPLGKPLGIFKKG